MQGHFASVGQGWLNPYPVSTSWFTRADPSRSRTAGNAARRHRGPVSATAGWAIRVPLLACPAVSNHYQTQHCWASRQWQPRESSIAVCVRHYTRMSRNQSASPPATASEPTERAERDWGWVEVFRTPPHFSVSSAPSSPYAGWPGLRRATTAAYPARAPWRCRPAKGPGPQAPERQTSRPHTAAVHVGVTSKPHAAAEVQNHRGPVANHQVARGRQGVVGLRQQRAGQHVGVAAVSRCRSFRPAPRCPRRSCSGPAAGHRAIEGQVSLRTGRSACWPASVT